MTDHAANLAAVPGHPARRLTPSTTDAPTADAATTAGMGLVGPGVAELDQVRRYTSELLADLDRPPRNLRIQAGAITVEITWPDPPAATTAAQATATGGTAATAGDGPAAAGVADPATGYLTSPMVGVFYHAREPGAEPFVTVGSVVAAGQQVGIVEAMKLMIPVEASRGGRVTAILKANGEPVEYDEPLFAVQPEAAG